MSSAICFNSDQSKILSSGNGLKIEQDVDRSKLKEFEDDVLNVTDTKRFFFERVETTWKKETILVSSIFKYCFQIFFSF